MVCRGPSQSGMIVGDAYIAHTHTHMTQLQKQPENIVIKSYTRVEVKLIDFGSSCFQTDHLSSYIQVRAAPYMGKRRHTRLGSVQLHSTLSPPTCHDTPSLLV